MKCKVCNGSSKLFSTTKVLQKYEVSYYCCEICGFVQTEEPYWLDKAYQDAITNSDIGMLQRNLLFSSLTKSVILAFFDRSGEFIDYGGGYGIFVRLMRDRGLDFYRYDKYCANLFAGEFDVESRHRRDYELLTAFELFEHLVSPVEEVEEMLTYSPSILLSTVLMPPSHPQPGNWWYYGLEHGQHVSLFTYTSLKHVAHRFGLNLFSNRSNLHLLTPKRLSTYAFRFFSSFRVAQIVSKFSRKSLLEDDYSRITGQRLS